MHFTIKEFAIVILAKSNNPTILNVDFLKINEICPKEFVAIEESILCTPAISKIEFKNNISVLVDTDRIMFNNKNVKTLNNDFTLPDIAINYLRTLPHVKYAALGINFTGHFENLDSYNIREFLLRKFFNERAWGKVDAPNSSLTLNFTFERNNVKFNITLGQGSIVEKDSPKKDVLFVR